MAIQHFFKKKTRGPSPSTQTHESIALSAYQNHATEKAYPSSSTKHSSPGSTFKKCFTHLCDLPLTHKFFIETQIYESSVWIEKQSSKRGHRVEIAKVDRNGSTSKIILPIGDRKKGCNGFLQSIDAYSRSTKKIPPQKLIAKKFSTIPPPSTSSASYKDALYNKQSPPLLKEAKSLLPLPFHFLLCPRPPL